MLAFRNLSSLTQACTLATLATVLLGLGAVYGLGHVPPVTEFVLRGDHYRLEAPRALLATLAIPWIIAFSFTSLAAIGRSHRFALAIGRSLLVLLLALVLAKPTLRSTFTRSSTLFLVDGSPSMPDAALEHAQRFAEDYTTKKRNKDVFLQALFDREVRIVNTPFVKARTGQTLAAASDYGQALRMAQGMLPQGANRRVVLFGDGNDTHGELLPAAKRLIEQGIELCVLPSQYPLPADASVRRLELPKHIELSRPFVVHGELFATRPMDVTVHLEHNGIPNPGDSERQLHLEVGHHPVTFETVTTKEGTNQFRLSLTAKGPDAFPENNQATISFDVTGRPKLLAIDSHPEAIGAFVRALTAQQIDVEVRSRAGLPTTQAELGEYDAVLLSNVAASSLGVTTSYLLDDFVRKGGTLLVSGGPEGYGAGGWSGSPLENLLPVYATIQDEQERPDLALVLAIDRSGSMTGLPLELAKSACSATVETLRPSDYIEVLAFDARPTRYVRMQPAKLRGAIVRDLSKMVAGGDTELFYALDMAYQDLVNVEARRKHVILLTDGQSPTTGISEIVQAMVADNITLTTVGLGTGVDTDLLKHLAERGGGRYHAAPTPDSLPRIFVRETETLTRPPEETASYEVRVKTHAPFLRGLPLAEAPRLAGYHRVGKKPSPAEVILESDRREPILARVPRGAGWVVAWTSDLHPRWANAWLRWPHLGQLFSQLLREQESDVKERELPMQVTLNQGHLSIEFDAIGEDGNFDNERSILLDIVGPDNHRIATEAVERVAPGRYRVELDLPKLGDYRIKAHHRTFDAEGNPKALGESHAQIAWSYPTEYAKLEPNLALLEQLMSVTQSGSCSPSSLAQANLRPELRYVSRRQPLLLMALFLFLAELTLKRLRFTKTRRHIGE
jgi:uncharacterized membrane protein